MTRYIPCNFWGCQGTAQPNSSMTFLGASASSVVALGPCHLWVPFLATPCVQLEQAVTNDAFRQRGGLIVQFGAAPPGGSLLKADAPFCMAFARGP